MSQSRALIGAAIAAAALYLIGAVALGSPPTATDSPSQAVTWFRDHHDWWRAIKSGEYLKYYEQQYVTR